MPQHPRPPQFEVARLLLKPWSFKGGPSRLWEHTFVTAQPHAHVRFRIAVERRALGAAEDAARKLPNLPLEEALQLVHLYFERGSPKAEPAARRWLVRYLSEGTPSLRDVARVTASLEKRAAST
jgi:hypothetical protein